jgi:hypothetical protein
VLKDGRILEIANNPDKVLLKQVALWFYFAHISQRRNLSKNYE